MTALNQANISTITPVSLALEEHTIMDTSFQNQTIPLSVGTISTVTENCITQGAALETTDAHFVFALLTLALCLTTIFGNASVLYMIFTTKLLQTHTNAFVASMATGDLFLGLLFMPLNMVSLLSDHRLLRENVLLCNLSGFVLSLSNSSTILGLMGASVDRAIAIKYPFRYHTIVNSTFTAIFTIYIWFKSLFFSLMPMLGAAKFEYLADRHACVVPWATSTVFQILYHSFCVWVPSLVIGISLFVVLRTLREHRRVFAIMPIAIPVTMVSPTTPVVNYRKTMLQSSGTLFLIVGLLTLLWLPYSLFDLMTWATNISLPCGLLRTLFWFATASSMANPVIFLSNKKFKQRFLQILPFPCPTKNETEFDIHRPRIGSDSSSAATPTQSSNGSVSSSFVSISTEGSNSSMCLNGSMKPVPMIDVKANTLQVPTMIVPKPGVHEHNFGTIVPPSPDLPPTKPHLL